MRFPEKVTFSDKYGPAMEVQTGAEAKEYLEACIEHCMRVGHYKRAAAEHIEKSNIGYCTGHFDTATADRVMQLFDCEHPVFGRGHPTPEEEFEMGRALGAAHPRDAK